MKQIFATRSLARLSMLTALALALHVAEGWLPPLFPQFGARLGLANIVTLYLLVSGGFATALIVLVARCALGSFFGGSLSGLLYSLCGGVTALALMFSALNVLRGRIGLWGVSVIGSVGHNTGQVLLAALLVGSPRMLSYLPFLTIFAIPTGWFIAQCAYFILKHFNKSQILR